MAAHTLLVIDDDPNNFDVIEAYLSPRGLDGEVTFQLHYANSGRDALALLDDYVPDIILLDVMMPDMDGIEVCRRIKAQERWHTVPIIMVTALTGKQDLAVCLAAGADDFVSKPIVGVELRARIQSMLRIKRHYDSLRQLLRLREDMAHMIVHDLRNPLASLLFGLEMLGKIDYPREQQQEKIAHLQRAGHTLQKLIDDILLLAKMEAGKLQLEPVAMDVDGLISTVMDDLRDIAALKQIRFHQIRDPTPTVLTGDPDLLRRVLDNLVANALKFSPTGGQVTLCHRVEPTGHVIEVADHGVGVLTHLRDTIFAKFETGTRLQGIAQLGLGLAFCKMVVESHGGWIQVQDNHPTGSIFVVFLPTAVLPATQF